MHPLNSLKVSTQSSISRIQHHTYFL